jgi:DNA polymerase I
MIQFGPRPFAHVTCVDFEFSAPVGQRPRPICMVARDVATGATVRLWEDDLRRRRVAPFPTGTDALTVAFYASAEITNFLVLGWPVPSFVLDLYAEFRNLTNGLPTVTSRGLLGAMAYFGLGTLAAAEKADMRALAIRGGPWTAEERAALLAYCESDVVVLEQLLRVILPRLDGDRSLLRGRYMIAAARVEHLGVPIDVDKLSTLREHWDGIRGSLIAHVDRDFGVYEGTSFRGRKFAAWLAAAGIGWPRLPSGALALDDDTFKELSRRHPMLRPLRDLRVSISQLKLHELAVGADGRNRCLLSAFGARSGRNTPRASKFIFGSPSWVRALIRPEPGMAIAYLDWQQQEFAIAAALSGDAKMLAAYMSTDPYTTFGQQIGMIPPDGTKQTHADGRALLKTVILGIQYGAGVDLLAARLDRSRGVAQHLLDAHRETYKTFWRWSDAAVDRGLLRGRLSTVFGWTLHVDASTNPRSLANYPMQANGSEMLRLAVIRATEAGVRVVAPVHDALLIEAPIDDLEAAVAMTQQAMADASYFVLHGVILRTDVQTWHHPDRFMTDRGRPMWTPCTASWSTCGGNIARLRNIDVARAHTRPFLLKESLQDPLDPGNGVPSSCPP